MRACEAINAARSTGPAKRPFALQLCVVPGATLISGLAVGDDGRAIVSSRDGLRLIDTGGAVIKHLVAAAGVGTVHVSGDLRRIVYSQWHGLSFYTPNGLIARHPTQRLYHVAVRPDGQRVIAWS